RTRPLSPAAPMVLPSGRKRRSPTALFFLTTALHAPHEGLSCFRMLKEFQVLNTFLARNFIRYITV
ncbi:hypothetical protein, partial [Fodinibius saliphilus]|uniref:hypothetical protein n=1 Tax=Fodinibius saliphilus TaxID=1920650 RepID=UPI001BB11492